MSGLPGPGGMQLPSLRALSLRHFLVIGFGCVFLLHLVFSYHSETYANTTSLSSLKQSVAKAGSALAVDHSAKQAHPAAQEDELDPADKAQMGADYEDIKKEKAPVTAGKYKKEKAAFVMLARNSDLMEALASIRQVEDRFNHKYHYDYIFLNEVEFSEEFKAHTSAICSGKTSYGLVPEEHWDLIPASIDMDKAEKLMAEMGQKPIPYGGSFPYRKMCRYQSGFFWRHPLLDNLEYYWRVEPGVKFFCNIDYDPFKFMKDNKKKYSFTVSIHEYRDTVATLWDSTKKFIDDHPEYLPKDNLMDWLSNDGGNSYNLCHFWSNFEIAALDLWRGDAYRDYFDFLDSEGGFFYERWGDAPVHSIAAALFLKKDEIHFFHDIGYRHEPFQHCPVHADRTTNLQCACDGNDGNNFEFHGYGCTNEFKKLTNWKHPEAKGIFGM